MGNENKEYEIGQAKHSQQRPRGPMGRGMGGGEKAKDLVGTWKKLLGYCKKYSVILVIAIICAAVGTICTLAGPDKLSEMRKNTYLLAHPHSTEAICEILLNC